MIVIQTSETPTYDHILKDVECLESKIADLKTHIEELKGNGASE